MHETGISIPFHGSHFLPVYPGGNPVASGLDYRSGSMKNLKRSSGSFKLHFVPGFLRDEYFTFSIPDTESGIVNKCRTATARRLIFPVKTP